MSTGKVIYGIEIDYSNKGFINIVRIPQHFTSKKKVIAEIKRLGSIYSDFHLKQFESTPNNFWVVNGSICEKSKTDLGYVTRLHLVESILY